MDAQTVYATLEGTLRPEKEIRQQAEEALKQFSGQPGYMAALFQVVGSPQVPNHLRQSAATYMKNQVRRRWEPSKDSPNEHIPEAEKEYVRENLLEALATAGPKMASQLTLCVREISIADFPHKWPRIVPQLQANLTPTTDPAHLRAALHVVGGITSAFRLRDNEHKDLINTLMDPLISVLIWLLEASLATPSPENSAFQHQIIKAIKYSFTGNVPACFIRDPAMFQHLCALTLRVIALPPPSPPPSSEPHRSPYWKAAKWAVQLGNLLFSQYSNPKLAEKKLKDFCTMYVQHVVPPTVDCFISLLGSYAGGTFLPERVLAELIVFVDNSLVLASTYAKIKPHLSPLLLQVCFPLLFFSPDDEETWTNDPQEHVRRCVEFSSDAYTPALAATNLIMQACKKRKSDALPIMMGAIAAIFEGHKQAPNPRQMDGALRVVAALNSVLHKPASQEQTELLLTMFVFPELDSQFPYLRARACQVFGSYSHHPFADIGMFQNAIRMMLANFDHPDLPVRVFAAISLRNLLEVKAVEEVVRPILPQLMDKLFAMMDEVGSEELVSTLEVLIDNFAEEMQQYAPALAQKLAQVFLHNLESQDDEEAALAAMGCCRALVTLLQGLQPNPAVLMQTEPHVAPVIARALKEDGLDFVEDALEILTFYTFVPETPSRLSWEFFDMMIDCFQQFAFDWLEDMVPPLDNYISKGTAVFLSDPRYASRIAAMVTSVLTNTQAAERDLRPAHDIAESLLVNCQGRVDHTLAEIITAVAGRIELGFRTHVAPVMCSEIIAHALYNNALLSMQILDGTGKTAVVFGTWFQNLERFSRIRDKKRVILGLSSMLRVPLQHWPASFQPSLGEIIKQLIVTTRKCWTQKTERAAQEAEEGSEEGSEEGDEDDDDELGEEDDDEEEELADDEDENVDKDVEYLAMLDKLRETGSHFDDLDDDEDLSSDEEDIDVTSVTDTIDEVVFFASCLNELLQRDGAVAQQVIGQQLDDTHRQVLNELGEEASRRIAAQAVTPNPSPA